MLVPPAIDVVMADPAVKVNAFIGPSHVSVIEGAKIYRSVVEKVPDPRGCCRFCEPVDVMESYSALNQAKSRWYC